MAYTFTKSGRLCSGSSDVGVYVRLDLLECKPCAALSLHYNLVKAGGSEQLERVVLLLLFLFYLFSICSLFVLYVSSIHLLSVFYSHFISLLFIFHLFSISILSLFYSFSICSLCLFYFRSIILLFLSFHLLFCSNNCCLSVLRHRPPKFTPR